MKNARILALLAAMLLAAAAFTGCGGRPAGPDASSSPVSAPDASQSDRSDPVSVTDPEPTGETPTSATGSAAATGSKTPAKTDAVTRPSAGTTGAPLEITVTGDRIDAKDMVLPDKTFKNKKIVVLTHGGEFQNIEKVVQKYGFQIEYVRVVNTEKNAKLQKMVSTNTSPDLFASVFFPTLVTRNYVQNLDKYIDFDSGVWSGIRPMLDNFKWNDKHYYVDLKYAVDGMIWYNKDIFEEYGKTDPWTLYKKGEWTWDAYTKLAKELTVDANKDGTPEQWGCATMAMELVNATTGKGFVSYTKNGLANNNLLSKEIARAIEFNMSLVRNKYMPQADQQNTFAKGKVAMYWGYLWEREPFSALIKTKSLGLAPVPMDPAAGKKYMAANSEGFFIPRGAKNPEAAATLLTCLRIVAFDRAAADAENARLKKAGVWTDEFQTVYDEISKCENLVLDPWATFGLGDYFGDFYTRAQTESWSKIAAEISPKVDATIAKVYSTNKK